MKPRYIRNAKGFRKIATDIQCPERMSEILTIALDDLELCEQDPNMEVNMGEWVTIANFYSDASDPKCYACLAGGVMVKTLNINSEFLREHDLSMTTPGKMEDKKWEIALAGLNQIRINRLWYVLDMVDGSPRNPFIVNHPKMRMDVGGDNLAMWDIEFPDYGFDPPLFKASMRQIAAWYKEWEDAQVSVD